MCGRYTITEDLAGLEKLVRFICKVVDFKPRYNLTPRQQATFRRNPNYWDPARIPASDKLVLRPVPDPNTRTAALLHSEGYSDFSVADPARELFWERIQSLSSNHGVFRLWTQENSPFWRHWGFATASIEDLERLPDEWKPSEEPWFTLELKNEAVINAALKNQFAGYTAAEKKSAEEIQTRSKKVMTVITIFCFGIFFICLLVFFYLIKTRNPFQH